MTFFDFKKKILSSIDEAWKKTCREYDLNLNDSDLEEKTTLEHPINPDFGDYSTNIAILLAQKYKVNQMEIGQKIKKQLSNTTDIKTIIKSMNVVQPGFINIELEDKLLLDLAKEILEIEKFKQKLASFQTNRKVLIEHTSPNTNKSLHIGHLRNNLIGMSLIRLLRTIGNKAISDCLYNDRGIHISKAMWGYLKNDHLNQPWKELLTYWHAHEDEWPTPQSLKLKPDHFVENFYKIGVKSEDNEVFMKEMREMLLAWEDGSIMIRDLWNKLNNWVYEGFALTYKLIGSSHNNNWYESEFYKEAKKTVDVGLKKKIFKKLENGAVLTNLSSFNLTDCIVQRSDGTSMYFTQDIYLTKLKINKFPYDRYIWVVGPEQQLHLKQVFAVCEQLGISKRDNLMHLWYGYVFLKNQGKMSSRKGTVVSIDSLVEESVKRSLNLIQKSSTKRGTSSLDEEKKIAEKVGLSAIKYAILKVDKHKDIYFDWDEALDIKGNCGPYIQYTYTRCFSVLNKKNNESNNHINIRGEIKKEEKELLRSLYKFPEVIILAAESYAPHYLAQFLYEISQKYNVFYEKCKIIDSNNEPFRIFLTATTSQVLKFGLEILGIDIVERM
ncbi:arginine--tRNA ligase [Candidatus Microgenomates bacterium]|nr:arginine--tRNA ligase [Candidatus Microgenomates bacterium]